jgi:acid stress-induced BolA-like protein IbaG/YrbA
MPVTTKVHNGPPQVREERRARQQMVLGHLVLHLEANEIKSLPHTMDTYTDLPDGWIQC